jgi:glycosyltransferase involved in cell wall biosynthesis
MIEAGTTEHAPWVIVAGGIHRFGGTDKANFALVEHLLKRNIRVHVVTHKIDDELLRHQGIRIELVPVPGGSWFAGERLLSFRGRQAARKIVQDHPDARVVVNGGNCIWGDINWVHRVHHAWAPRAVAAPLIHRLKHRLASASAKRRENRSVQAARLIIANSESTRRQLIWFTGADAEKVRTVPLGTEPEWKPPLVMERSAARERWRQQPNRPMVLFIGAIGYDNNKGLDTLLQAWDELCRQPDWDADLFVVGSGRALPKWQSLVSESPIKKCVRFVGFTSQISDLLAAADLLVSPVRYESFGLNVQEALCRGVPAIVSGGAGVAEIYPGYLQDLLLPDPENVGDLVRRMLMWRTSGNYWKERVVEFSADLRRYTWQDMAERIYQLALQRAPAC